MLFGRHVSVNMHVRTHVTLSEKNSSCFICGFDWFWAYFYAFFGFCNRNRFIAVGGYLNPETP